WDKINEVFVKSKNKCSHKNFWVSENAFIKKKNLFDFIEYYDSIKSKLVELDTSEKEKYCEYIKKNFELYFVMKHEDSCKNTSVYDEEKSIFKTKFIDNNEEVEFLKKICNDKYLEAIEKVYSNEVILTVPNEFDANTQVNCN
ncbi:hypothetical protein PCYB_007970, partial [Plasmodium cynomolgi strain B]